MPLPEIVQPDANGAAVSVKPYYQSPYGRRLRIAMPKPYYKTALGKLYHGDCLDIMPHLYPVDLVLTDPPYGINRDKGFEGATGFGGKGAPIARQQYSGKWDGKRPPKNLFDLLIKKGKLSLIFGGNYFSDLLPQSTHWIVWDKKNTMPTFGDCELIWTNDNKKSVKMIECEYNGLLGRECKRVHPTQKPVKLIIELLEKYKPNKSVLDAFLGSGTTAIACERLKRKWIGIEIDLKFCEVAVKRIEQENRQLKLF